MASANSSAASRLGLTPQIVSELWLAGFGLRIST
jgi:hypothetical protein